jgi:hypothetical protein
MLFAVPLTCFYGSQNSDFWVLVNTTLTDWFCITEVESTDCMVRTDILYKIDTFHL